MKKVILDCLGGDDAPRSAVEGAILALKRNNELELVLVGDKSVIEPRINAAGFGDRAEILHATENISGSETPTVAIKSKPNSSVVVGQTALKERDDCGAFLSAGSTGAVLTGAFLKVGRIDGVSRPAMCPLLPTRTGKPVLLIDCGANMDSKPVNLVHFALMADVYMRALGVENPRVALVNVGTEDGKGDELARATFELLKKCKGLNFLGNMEARETFSGDYDIVVCDGFAGNVLLKTLEGTNKFFSHELKKSMNGFAGFLAKLLIGRKLLKMKKRLSEEANSGAMFIGMKKPVVKAHGNSNPEGFCNAILYSARAAQLELGEHIKTAIAKYEESHGGDNK